MYIHSNRIEPAQFEWSDFKDMRNFNKHGVWFLEAQTVWKDPLAQEFFDVDHSGGEDRFLKYGHSASNRLLLVVYCEHEDGGIIRIISARLVTQEERIKYEEGV